MLKKNCCYCTFPSHYCLPLFPSTWIHTHTRISALSTLHSLRFPSLSFFFCFLDPPGSSKEEKCRHERKMKGKKNTEDRRNKRRKMKMVVNWLHQQNSSRTWAVLAGKPGDRNCSVADWICIVRANWEFSLLTRRLTVLGSCAAIATSALH